jgi:hypothetical protein
MQLNEVEGEINKAFTQIREANRKITAVDASHNEDARVHGNILDNHRRDLDQHNAWINEILERLEKLEQSQTPEQRFACRLGLILSHYEEYRPNDDDMAEWVGRIVASQKLQIEAAHEAIDESNEHPNTHPYALCERIQMMRRSWGRTIELRDEEVAELKEQLERQTNGFHLLNQSVAEIDAILIEAGYGTNGTCAERVREIARELEQRRRK